MTDEDPALTEPWGDMMGRAMSNPLPKSHTYKPSAHTAAVKAIVDSLRHLVGWKRVRKRQVGRFVATDGAGNPRKVNGRWLYINVAVAGDPDVSMLWTPPGFKRPLAVEIEVKTGTGRLSTVQADARDSLVAGGAFHIVAADGAEAVAECQRVAEYVRVYG